MDDLHKAISGLEDGIREAEFHELSGMDLVSLPLKDAVTIVVALREARSRQDGESPKGYNSSHDWRAAQLVARFHEEEMMANSTDVACLRLGMELDHDTHVQLELLTWFFKDREKAALSPSPPIEGK